MRRAQLLRFPLLSFSLEEFLQRVIETARAGWQLKDLLDLLLVEVRLSQEENICGCIQTFLCLRITAKLS